MATALLAAHLVGAHLGGDASSGSLWRKWDALFSFDREDNLFSAVNALFFVGNGVLLVGMGGRMPRRRGGFWIGLGLLFLVLSGDEWFAWHERWVPSLRQSLRAAGPFFFAWVVPYGLGTLLLGLLALPRLREMPRLPRQGFCLAAGLFLAGALGLEMVEGYWYERVGQQKDPVYAILMTLEELLELAGLMALFCTLLARPSPQNSSP